MTPSGWAILANSAGLELLPIKPGSPTKAAMGYRLEVVGEDGVRLPAGRKGYLVAHPPLPPGNLMTIWGDDQRYIESYWSGPGAPARQLYLTGDFAIEDEDGYFFVLGRADEVINVAGHRLGTREVEEAISGHHTVAEVSAIGVKDEIKGETIAAFVVLKQDVTPGEEVERGIKQLVREKIGPVAVPSLLRFVRALPKTRSGKVLRRVLKALCEEKSLGDLSTIEDGATIDEIKSAIEEKNVLLAMFISFLAGVLLSLTPCIYPIIPITIGVIGAGSGQKKSRGFILSLFYVLGISCTFAVLGVIAAASGGLFGAAAGSAERPSSFVIRYSTNFCLLPFAFLLPPHFRRFQRPPCVGSRKVLLIILSHLTTSLFIIRCSVFDIRCSKK